MITFSLARAKLAKMGVALYDPKQKFIFIFEKVKILCPMVYSFIGLGLYFFQGADNLEEYINTIFFLSIQFICIFSVAYCIYNTNRIYRILKDFEITIDASKYQIDILLIVMIIGKSKINICRNRKYNFENNL